MYPSAEPVVVVLAIGLSLTMVAAAVGKGLRLLPPTLWPGAPFREGQLVVVPELIAIVLEAGIVWSLWRVPAAGFLASAVLFSGFDLYLAWLVSRGVKRCNCFGPPTPITQNKLAVNYGVALAASTGAFIAGPDLTIFQCLVGVVMICGFAAFVWSSRFVARRQELDQFRQPPAVGVPLEEERLARRCMLLFVTPGCSGCENVLERVRQLGAADYPRYVVIDPLAPEPVRLSARQEFEQDGLLVVDDAAAARLRERLSVQVFPSVVSVDDGISTASGVYLDGLTAALDNLASLG